MIDTAWNLNNDVSVDEKNLLEAHYLKGAPLPSNSVVDIEGMCGENYRSKKVRKFACKSLRNLGNRSGIRVIFVIEEEDLKITFIEIYHKSDKELENKERLKKYLQIYEK